MTWTIGLKEINQSQELIVTDQAGNSLLVSGNEYFDDSKFGYFTFFELLARDAEEITVVEPMIFDRLHVLLVQNSSQKTFERSFAVVGSRNSDAVIFCRKIGIIGVAKENFSQFVEENVKSSLHAHEFLLRVKRVDSASELKVAISLF